MDIRERVLTAALDCFTEDGYDRTTISRIRERSGVSNGALFHHFPNKEAIAGALYLEAMQSVQQSYWNVLDNQPATLGDAVEGIVRNLLAWIEGNPRWAGFLYAQGHLEWSTPAGSELNARNRDLAGAYQAWLGQFIASGEVRDLPMVVVVAIVTGPAHAIAQRWLAGQVSGSLLTHTDDLVDAAVAGLSGSPAPRRRRGHRPAPVEGRIHVQLLAADGTVVAEGNSVTTLTASTPEKVHTPRST